MPKENLSNGAFQVSRSLFDSAIWTMPPEYLKLWIFIIGKANHAGKKYRGFACGRGEFFTTHEELEDNLSYQIGFRTHRPYEGCTKRITKYLVKADMIATTKAPRGLLIKVLRYEEYQTLRNYERSHEGPDERSHERSHEGPLDAPSINKNGRMEETDTTYPPEGAPRADQPRKEYGNPNVNLLIDTLKDAMGLAALDGTVKANRNAANVAIKKLSKTVGDHERAAKLIAHAITQAAKVRWHSNKMTSMKYVAGIVTQLVLSYPLPDDGPSSL